MLYFHFLQPEARLELNGDQLKYELGKNTTIGGVKAICQNSMYPEREVEVIIEYK